VTELGRMVYRFFCPVCGQGCNDLIEGKCATCFCESNNEAEYQEIKASLGMSLEQDGWGR
jgi:NMD protein affecting ribosome stability and mRNA decay